MSPVSRPRCPRMEIHRTASTTTIEVPTTHPDTLRIQRKAGTTQSATIPISSAAIAVRHCDQKTSTTPTTALRME